VKHQITYSNVSRETIEYVDHIFNQNKLHLEQYAVLLLWWNKKINLVSRSLSQTELHEHIKHCLYLSALIRGEKYFVDAGCGGGLPGIPLAIIFPDKKFHLVDKVHKKILSVKDMLRKLRLANAEAESVDLSKVKASDKAAIVSKHAFKIYDLINYAEQLKPSKYFILKGKDFKEELVNVKKALNIKAIDLSEIGEFYTDKLILEISVHD
jgi:16S rRNA (guanine527-N7)-methyltransferase